MGINMKIFGHMIVYIRLWIYYSYPQSIDKQCLFFVAGTMSHHRNVTCSVQHSASYKPLCSVNIHFLCIIYEVVILLWSMEWIILIFGKGSQNCCPRKKRKTKMTRWSHGCVEVTSVCCNYPSVLVILMFHCDELKRNQLTSHRVM